MIDLFLQIVIEITSGEVLEPLVPDHVMANAPSFTSALKREKGGGEPHSFVIMEVPNTSYNDKFSERTFGRVVSFVCEAIAMVLLGTYANKYAPMVGGLWPAKAREWRGWDISHMLKRPASCTHCSLKLP